MLQDSSSSSEDEAQGSLFLGRHKKPQVREQQHERSPSDASRGHQRTSSDVVDSLRGQHQRTSSDVTSADVAKFMMQGSGLSRERSGSADVVYSSTGEIDRQGNSVTSLKVHSGRGPSGYDSDSSRRSRQASNHESSSPHLRWGSHQLESPRRGSQQLETPRRGSHQLESPLRRGSRSSPRRDSSPSSLSDYVLVSKDKDKRMSAALFDDWTLIGGSCDESDVGGPEAGDDDSVECKKLYLLVARCIAYPFNAKYQIETTPPRAKLNAARFGSVCRTLRIVAENFEDISWELENKLTNQELDVVRTDDFVRCLRWMNKVVLVRPDIIEICSNGGFSAKELESIFKVKASIALGYGPEATSNSEVTLWCNTFRKLVEQCGGSFSEGLDMRRKSRRGLGGVVNPGGVVNQDKLYKVFQEILKVRSIEHQVLYRECQLGNPEEQEAVVRRELQTRTKILQDTSQPLLEGKFGSRRVEEIYREEQLKMLKQLNSNLDQLSLQGTSINTIEKKKKKGNVSETGNVPVSKQDLQFNLKVKVTIHDLSDLQPAYEGKPLFFVFGLVDSSRDPFQTQPVETEYSTVPINEEGEFWMNSPIPQVKLELRSVSKRIFSDSKLISKYVHTALPSSSDIYSTISLYPLDVKKDKDSLAPLGKVRLSTIVERPSSMKKCGYLVAVGDHMYKQKKKRFFSLIQLSQYKFLFCSYHPNASMPKETLLLDQGITVEYAPDNGQLDSEPDAKFLFDLVFDNSDLGRIHLGCRDMAERQSWVEWMVRGTGQSTQPQQLDEQEVVRAGSNDLERYNLKAVVDLANNMATLEPHKLFTKLFRLTLQYRLDEDLFSRGLFSPAQMYVLDEFCARYGVRDPFRHLTYLQDWLDYTEGGVSIWPVMMQSSYRFCQMHIGGMNPPEKSMIVTADEREVFVKVCQRILDVVMYQVQNFRTCFPFCCPRGDLRTMLKLFDLLKGHSETTASSFAETPEGILTRIMEKSALTNYKQVYSNIQGDDSEGPMSVGKIFELARACIDFMYELHDFFWEEFSLYKEVFVAHISAYWSFFLVDMREAIAHSQDTVLQLKLFHLVNNYFISQPTMKLEEFHHEFLKDFTPVVVQYIDALEAALKQDLAASLAQETWLPVTNTCCEAVEKMMKSIYSFKRFLQELSWPEEAFASFLEQKVAAICADRFQEAADVIQIQLGHLLIAGKGSTTFTYSLPLEFFTMINTLVYLSSQVMRVCASQQIQIPSEGYNDESSLEHAATLNIEEHLSGILNSVITMAISKLCNPLQSLLIKLNKFDPSDGFLASLKMMIPTVIPINSYTEFLTSNLEIITSSLAPAIYNNFVVNWYECQMQLLNQWLEKRPDLSLHRTQLSSADEIFKTLYVSFVKCEVPPRQLRSQSHDAVEDRVRMETSHRDLMSVGKD